MFFGGVGYNDDVCRIRAKEGVARVLVREIAESDYATVCHLWSEVIGNKWATEDAVKLHFDKTKDNRDYDTFVAVVDGEVVGFITAVTALSPGWEVGYMHLQCMAVQENSQGKGIGSAMLEHLENHAMEKGVFSMILNTGKQRKEAHTFYEQHGYEGHSYCFSKMMCGK